MTDAASTPTPSVFSIALERRFLDALAATLRTEAGRDPLALAGAVVLLPTRRACLALGKAFARHAAGGTSVLPDIRPLGEPEGEEADDGAETLGAAAASADLPPAIGRLRRLALLTQLVQARDADLRPEQALRLAESLARLLDQAHIQRCALTKLERLVDDPGLSAHWQLSLRFLSILEEVWPQVLANEGKMDPAARRNAALEALAATWRRSPPRGPVIIAGSTGSTPATADLLVTAARLPHGRIVLPGLDRTLDDDAWEMVLETLEHPQHTMARLLARFGIARHAVAEWPRSAGEPPPAPPRARLIAETMRPAESTERWRDAPPPAAALQGLCRIDCPTAGLEAATIALILRRTLETPGRTAALTTPDRTLARRVAAELRRWDLVADDSAGHPLEATPAARLLRLLATAVADDLAPTALLALLKHPLATLGLPDGRRQATLRRLERDALRGPTPGAGLAGLRAAVAEAAERNTLSARWTAALRNFLDTLEDALAPLLVVSARPEVPAAALLAAHLDAARRVAGDAALTRGPASAALRAFLDEVQGCAALLPALAPQRWPETFSALMRGHSVRLPYGAHPRLAILGPLEARLQRADVMILGGLNEGVWPPAPPDDPWLSRPMRRALDLLSPERRIGLSAHDFCQALSGATAILTRTEKADGQPTRPSRWLERLDAVLGRGDGNGNKDVLRPPEPWLPWAQALSRAPHHPRGAPAPRPPLAARPRRLSVTAVDTLARDPYAVFARDILRLQALEPLEADLGAADRGRLIHRALEDFIRAFPTGPLPPDAEARLLEIGRRCFGAALERPAVRGFWWPRFETVAAWVVAEEQGRRAHLIASHSEIRGAVTFDAPGGPFTLTARADRIDQLCGGSLAIIDYKTGAAPTPKDMVSGWASQLTLTAAIAAAGGFAALPAAPAATLEYWKLSGSTRTPGARITVPAPQSREYRDIDPATLAAHALAGAQALIARFDAPDTPYLSAPRPDRTPRHSDYRHLARSGEWRAGDAEEAE